MLFKRADLDRIVAGEVSLAFRRWKRPSVRAGGRLRTAVGELAIGSVEVTTLKELTLADARRAGYASLNALRTALRGSQGALYRVGVAFAGADTRVALRQQAKLEDAERDALLQRLGRMDARSADGPWTAQVLRKIAGSPAVRAGDLASELGMQRLPFKQRVRRLKDLGLTESLEVGYRLSPRGRSVSAALSDS